MTWQLTTIKHVGDNSRFLWTRSGDIWRGDSLTGFLEKKFRVKYADREKKQSDTVEWRDIWRHTRGGDCRCHWRRMRGQGQGAG